MPIRHLLRALAPVLMLVPLSAFACEGELHVELEQVGVYALDHAEIVATQPGLADCAVDDLWLSQAGKEVPLHVVARGARFADGDRIEWIGTRLHGPESWNDPYAVNNVYVLGASAGAHARMRVAEAAGEGRAALERQVHLEQENLMIRLDQNQQKPGEEPDVWQWAKLTHVDPQPFELRFDLADLDPHGGSARLALAFRGLSELQRPRKGVVEAIDDHVVELTLNGAPLAAQGWSGRDEVRREIELPVARLKAHDNLLVMRVPKRALPWAAKQVAVDVVMFNYLDARYPAGGDIDANAGPLSVRADAAATLQLSAGEAPALYGEDGVLRLPRAIGARRHAYAPAASGVELLPATARTLAKPVFLRAVRGEEWRAPAQGYDYLIVAHPRLLEAIEPLAEFHRKRGLSVAVLDIDSVYDQYNHGIAHPQAIRNLVDAAWHRWPSKPRFLLLVGDSSFDIRHETYDDLAYAKWTDRELLFPGHFGAVPGGTYANAPKKLADRNLIPTWQYPSPEGQSASDNWFGAVDGDDWHPVVAVGRFPVVEPEEVAAIVDKTIAYIAKPQLGAWRRDVMFIADEIDTFQRASDEIAGALGKEGFLADKVYAKPDVTENAVHQRAIHDGIDAGRLLVHFIGHGGRYIWRTGPPDLRKNNDLFTLDDVSKLGNGARLPMVLSMTCYSAPFDNPTEDSIGERFLREKDKGAIAVFAASWRNSPSPAFSKDVIAQLLEPGATIGEAIVRAKKKSQDRVLVEMYNLLGDPAVVLERPHDDLVAAFDGDRWNPGLLVDLRQAGFDGEVAVDWLGADGSKLASSSYVAHTERFRLPLPAGTAMKVIQARIYAASPTSGRDAVGGAELGLASPPSIGARFAAAWKRWWHPSDAPQRRDDTIAILDFDGPAR